VKKLVLSVSALLFTLLVGCGDTGIVITTPTTPTTPIAGSSASNPSSIALGVDNQTASGPFSLTDTVVTDNKSTSFYYQVDIPGDAGGDGIWFEIQGVNGSNLAGIADIILVSKDNNDAFQAVRRSTGPESFGTMDSFASTELATNAIVPIPVDQATECRGPCIFVPYPANKTAGTALTALLAVRVYNTHAINYNLYTYAASYYDETENINNQCNDLGIQSINPEITVIGTNPDYVGAIEAIGDTDCFLSSDVTTNSINKVKIELPAETTIPVIADIYNFASGAKLGSCQVSPATPSCTTPAFTGTGGILAVKVRSAQNKAAPFVNAKYNLFFQ